MNLLILLAVTAVSDWTYIGFVADPEDPTVPAINIPPAVPPVPKPEPEGSRPKAESKAAVHLSVTTPPVLPNRWRLADSSGQVWEFRDPERLKSWVAGKNAELIATASSPPPVVSSLRNHFPSPPVCQSGQCPSGL